MGVREKLYGHSSREALLYDERIKTRPSSDRLNAVGKMLLGKLAESALNRVPDAQGDSTSADIYNGLKNGLRQSAGAYKHNGGVKAFKNNIPVLKKVVQNFWSLYHLKDGVSTIDSFYTVERGGNEYLLGVQRDGTQISLNELDGISSQISGNEAEYHNSLIKSVTNDRNYDDWNAEKAKVYTELTDGDAEAKGFLEPTRLKPVYRGAELRFIGGKGQKTLVGHTSSGDKIFKYKKPSAQEFLKFYTKMDLYYTAITTTARPAENLLTGMAKQDIYEREAANSVKLALGHYAAHRDDGFNNPIQLYR